MEQISMTKPALNQRASNVKSAAKSIAIYFMYSL
jgi:hypothetical protein